MLLFFRATRIYRFGDLHAVFAGEFNQIRKVAVEQGSMHDVDQLILAHRTTGVISRRVFLMGRRRLHFTDKH